MGIFNSSNILQENFTSSSVVPLSNYNESYFSLAMEYCKSINEEYDTANKVLYKALLEAGDNYEVINESFDDFFTKIKEIVAKFIKFLKNLIDKFSTKLHQLVKSDKYITKNEKMFGKFTTDNEFQMQLFNFTHLEDNNIPLACAQTTFAKEFDKVKIFVNGDGQNVKSLTAIEADKRVDSLRTAYRELVDSYEDFYDVFRGEVIGERSIDASDYPSELYKKFRDGDDSTTSTTVTTSLVNSALTRFKAHEKTIKSIKDIQKKLEKDYSEISKHVEKIVSSRGEKLTLIGWSDVSDVEAGKYSPEVISELNMIAKAESNKVQQMSTIHLQAMGAKLDAVNASFKQDKALLYKSLSELQKWKNVKNESAIEEDAIPIPVNSSSNGTLLETVSCYEMYMTLEAHNQDKMDRYFTECMAIESGNSKVLHYISEGALESIKDFIQKIINKIKEFFGKVVEGISATFEKDQTYLKQYKEIILNKKNQLGTLNDFYEYKIKEMVSNSPMPVFNYDSQKSYLDTQENFIKNDQTFKKITMKAEQSFGDATKFYFMGEPKSIDAEKINMTDLYNFCWDFNNTKKALNNELNELDKAKVKAIQLAEKVSKEGPSSSQSTDTSTTPSQSTDTSSSSTSTNDAKDKQRQEIQKQIDELNAKPSLTSTDSEKLKDLNDKLASLKESVIYSSVYGRYVSEAVLLEVEKDGSSKDTKSSSVTPAAPSSNQKMSSNANLKYGRKDEDLKSSMSGDNPDDVSKKVNVYFNTCSEFLMAKINVFEKAYKDYMWIIREHVKSYAGDKERKNKDHAAQAASITFNAPDEALNSLNTDQERAEYQQQLKAIKDKWKTYYGTFKGTEYYSLDGTLPKQGKKIENPSDKADIMKQLLEKFKETDEYKAYKEYWDKTFKGYNFEERVQVTEFENEPK